jgi:ribosomal protein S18 acetylase RimI-like enzyme
LGIGRALVDDVKAVEPEISLWTFQANTRAIAFYRREGFAEAERTEGQRNDERLPDIRMIWRRG